MNKLKLFIENFLVYGFGGIISKIIPLIMVPIITRLMPDSTYFGISDLATTIVSFGSSLAIMGMYDAMYRLFFEREDIRYKKEVCSTTLGVVGISSSLILLVMVSSRRIIANLVFGDVKYAYLVCITAVSVVVSTLNSIVSAPTRMQNKRNVFLVINTIMPILSYAIAVYLISNEYYVIALPIAAVISAMLSLLVFGILNHNWFSLVNFQHKYLKEMLKFAIPLLPNALVYWIFNSSDRLMISHLLGIHETGIYAVGAKLGYTSQLIYTAFAGGWQFFAFSTMKETKQVESNSKVFEYLGIISYICTCFIFSLSAPIYSLLFEGDYVKGYIVAPYLFLAPLLQMLFQVSGNQFLVIKKTWPTLLILSGGTIVNILLNFWLIPRIGIEGAAIATVIGYTVSNIVCGLVLSKMKLFLIRKRFLLSTAIMLGFILMWRFVLISNVFLSIAGSLLYMMFWGILYKEDMKSLIVGIRGD